MKENHLYLKGRLAYSFGKNGKGLSNEFEILDPILKLFSKDNHITIHKSFIDQADDVYDLVFDIEPNTNVDYLFEDTNKEKNE